jgi:flagellar transcriptional activator FlhC
MPAKSILQETRQIERAVSLIHLGARLQVLESETDLSYERLLRLYKEVAGKSSPKGQLPYSTDWFLTWQPNIHASLFANIFIYLSKTSPEDDIDVLIKAYGLYTEQISELGMDLKLSVTRAWLLTKFLENNMLVMTCCTDCGGMFIREPYENSRHFVCALCAPPARAGKGMGPGCLRVH